MKVLIIEDSDTLATLIAQALRTQYGHEVTWVRDPLKARELDENYDVIVVDLLFRHLDLVFNRRRLGRQVSLTRDQLLITGLTAVEDALSSQSPAKVVLWTSGETNRHLHLMYAYDELGVRAYCSKNADTHKLNAAIEAAAHDREYVDRVLDIYVKPAKRIKTISQILLRNEKTRAIWRAVALGAHSRSEIEHITGFKNIGNLMLTLRDDLVELDRYLKPGRPLAEVVRFANSHWEFFLDDAVRTRFE